VPNAFSVSWLNGNLRADQVEEKMPLIVATQDILAGATWASQTFDMLP